MKIPLRYFFYSIIINLIIGALFVIFVMNPMTIACKEIAKVWCYNLHLTCEFKEKK